MDIKKYKWSTIKRRHHYKIPWGYTPDSDDNELLHPIVSQLDALETAKDFLLEQDCSSREVSLWLSEFTGVSISHMGLIKRIRYDNERFREQKR